ncbi:MAG: hydrolase [Lachnospiraceae bacterium]|nr:hydrolase [Lachnospiraceae bacterium]
MNIGLYIFNGKTRYEPVVLEEVKVTWQRKNTPGKLEFKVHRKGLKCTEGNAVAMYVGKVAFFYGYIFKKSRSEEDIISITAYDQLRYLKNKDTYNYSGKASDFIKRVASDFGIKTGKIADTNYSIPPRIEDNSTLFDMFQNALDLTMANTGKIYTLYDKFGELTLSDMDTMITNVLIDKDTCTELDYTSSIDDDTYNKIKLTYDNEETGKRDVYIAKDSSNINKWGVLQYYDTLQEGENGQAKVEQLLKYYNRKTRNLSVKKAIGSTKVRGGSYIVAVLSLGDINVKNYMLVEKVVHKFEAGKHFMDLTLAGGEFVE